MVNYANSKLYTIRSYSRPDLVYVGSTTQPLYKRFGTHKSTYKRWKRGHTAYTSSFEVIDIGDSYIELLKAAPCSSKEELTRFEGDMIRSMDCVNINLKSESMKRQDLIERAKKLMRGEMMLGDDAPIQAQCECGATHNKAKTHRHRRSKKHKQWQELHAFINS